MRLRGGRGGGSGLLGAGRQDHGGGEAVDAESRDVDLIAAVGRELRRDRDRDDVIMFIWTNNKSIL